jgi:hypothetical protein
MHMLSRTKAAGCMHDSGNTKATFSRMCNVNTWQYVLLLVVQIVSGAALV